MCTNAILLDRFYKKARPHKRLSINVHLDGMQKTHDYVVDRTGVFDKAVAMIKEGKRLGYYVCTNTTVYRETDVAEIEEMCAFLTGLDVDGILLSPGYHYESIPGDEHFLFLEEIHQKFRASSSSPSATGRFLHAAVPPGAAGSADYRAPVGQPHYTPKGWKALLPDRRPALRHLEGVLRRRRLGLLGDARTRAAQLQDALGFERRVSASWASGSPTCSRWRAGSWRTCATRGGARRRLARYGTSSSAPMSNGPPAGGCRPRGRSPALRSPSRRSGTATPPRGGRSCRGADRRRCFPPPGQRVDVGEGEGRRPPVVVEHAGRIVEIVVLERGQIARGRRLRRWRSSGRRGSWRG